MPQVRPSEDALNLFPNIGRSFQMAKAGPTRIAVIFGTHFNLRAI